MLAPEVTLARFWSYVDQSGGPDACWPWLKGRDDQGYGVWYADGNKHKAHRWLLGHLRGRPLIGRQSGVEDGCHRCDNPPCCNPRHLYVGTRKRNVADAVERSRLWQLRRTHCPAGHPYSGDNLEVRKSGARRCKACTRASDHRRRTEERTICKRGHPLSGDNVRVFANGKRRCLTCEPHLKP